MIELFNQKLLVRVWPTAGVLLLEEDVVLWTHAQGQADGVHVRVDVPPIDGCCSRGGSKHASQDRPTVERRKRERERETINSELHHSLTEAPTVHYSKQSQQKTPAEILRPPLV